MCHFITMVAPKDTDMGLLRSELKKHHREVLVVENRHVNKHLKAGELYFCAAPKFCDCGTALGRDNIKGYKKESQQKKLDKSVSRFRRIGWSEAKIERWLRDSNQAIEKNTPDGPDGTTSEWSALIKSLLEQHKLRYVGILLHMYSGNFENSPKSISRKNIKNSEGLNDKLLTMNEDVLYIIER